MVPRQRSLPSGVMVERRHSDLPASRHSSSAARTSWPSAKMSASTVIGWPMMRRTAKPGALGTTRSITTGERVVAALAECACLLFTGSTASSSAISTSPGCRRSGIDRPSSRRGSPSMAPAPGSSGLRLTGTAWSLAKSLLIRTTSPCCACRGSAASRRASAVTAADDPVRRRTAFVARRSRSRSAAACRISPSTSAANPSGRNRPSVVATASRNARRRAATSAGRLRASATTPKAGAMRASASSSSTYQAALPSHHAVDAKTPSRPAPASSPCRDQARPGVHAHKAQSVSRRVAATISRNAPAGRRPRPSRRKAAAPALANRTRCEAHQDAIRSASGRTVTACAMELSRRGSTTLLSYRRSNRSPAWWALAPSNASRSRTTSRQRRRPRRSHSVAISWTACSIEPPIPRPGFGLARSLINNGSLRRARKGLRHTWSRPRSAARASRGCQSPLPGKSSTWQMPGARTCRRRRASPTPAGPTADFKHLPI